MAQILQFKPKPLRMMDDTAYVMWVALCSMVGGVEANEVLGGGEVSPSESNKHDV